jgi:hypothetical protein
MLVTSVALAPNAAVFGTAWLLGPGFALGAGTSVTLTGTSVGALPAIPLLAAVPAQPPGPARLLLVVPLLVGGAVGLLVARRHPTLAPRAAAALAATAGGLGGAALAVAAWAAGGPLGPGRLATVGPSPWRVGVYAAVELAVPAALAAAARVAYIRSRGGSQVRERSENPVPATG